jgi:hypothetical protein
MPDMNERLGADWAALTDDQRAAVERGAKTDGSWWFSAGYDDAAIRRHAASFLHAKPVKDTPPAPEMTEAEQFDAEVRFECARIWGHDWADKMLGAKKLNAYAAASRAVRDRKTQGETNASRAYGDTAHKAEADLSLMDRYRIGTAIDADRRIAAAKAGTTALNSSNISSLTRQLLTVRQSLPGLRKSDPALARKGDDLCASIVARLERAGCKVPAE